MLLVVLTDPPQVGLDDGLLILAVVLVDVPVHVEDGLQRPENLVPGMFRHDELFASAILGMTPSLHVAGVLEPVDEDSG